MRAYRLFGPHDTRLVEIDAPRPGPGEALLRVLAVGVCHSDLHVRDGAPGAAWTVPFTLGHEICAVVEQLPAEAGGLAVGDQVLVHGPTGCGACRRCVTGAENVCDRRGVVGSAGVGLGRDGGMADLLVTDVRRLVPAAGLDPVTAAPLTDAALTSLHAVRCCTGLGPDSTAVVIGAGGLGHVAIRLLQALTGARVVAVDTRREALDLAVRVGAAAGVPAGPDAATAVLDLTGGAGADAVLDFVTAPTTTGLATGVVAAGGDLVLVGGGGGSVTVRKPSSLPPDVRVSVPFWGSRSELAEVVDLARRGVVEVQAVPFALADADAALAALERGEIVGRAVLVP